MTSPDVHSPILVPPEEIHEDRRNGYAYWMNLPQPAISFSDAVPGMKQHGGFTELPTIIDVLDDHGSVMVMGEPGSGKSHLVRDLQVDAVINSVPAFCLTVHVNAGKRNGLDNIAPQFDAFRAAAQTAGSGILILDNVDFLGYKGRSRKIGPASEYAARFKDFLGDVLQNKSLAVLATAHDNQWRDGRWTWDNDAVDTPAQAVLDAFPNRLVFEGKMALDGLVQVLLAQNRNTTEQNPGISIGMATRVMRSLDQQGRANFFHANHLDVGLFLTDPEAAIQQIDHGRDVRRGLADHE